MGWEDLEEKLRIVMVLRTVTVAIAIKIDIALEININSSSLTDRGEGTNDFKSLSHRILSIKVTFHDCTS